MPAKKLGESDTVRIDVKIPRDLKEKAQAKCPNLSKLIRELLEQYLSKSAPNPAPSSVKRKRPS